jgi:hypothetical protein
MLSAGTSRTPPSLLTAFASCKGTAVADYTPIIAVDMINNIITEIIRIVSSLQFYH